MSVERINLQLKKVREQIAQLQAKEKDLAEQKQMEDEVRQLLQKREQEKEGLTNEKEEVIR